MNVTINFWFLREVQDADSNMGMKMWIQPFLILNKFLTDLCF